MVMSALAAAVTLASGVGGPGGDTRSAATEIKEPTSTDPQAGSGIPPDPSWCILQRRLIPCRSADDQPLRHKPRRRRCPARKPSSADSPSRHRPPQAPPFPTPPHPTPVHPTRFLPPRFLPTPSLPTPSLRFQTPALQTSALQTRAAISADRTPAVQTPAGPTQCQMTPPPTDHRQSLATQWEDPEGGQPSRHDSQWQRVIDGAPRGDVSPFGRGGPRFSWT